MNWQPDESSDDPTDFIDGGTRPDHDGIISMSRGTGATGSGRTATPWPPHRHACD